MYEKARKAFEKVLGNQYPVYGTVCFNLGSLRKAEKKFEEAETWYKRSGEITKKQIKINFVGLSEIENSNDKEALQEKNKLAGNLPKRAYS